MKKSVLLMAGFLALALAGSAQATGTAMFAVQNGSAQDQMVVDQTGWIGIGTSTPVAPFHVVSAGNSPTAAGFNYTFKNTGTLSSFKAPNFTFYRYNDAAATGAKNPNDPTFPRANDTLGVLQFGTIAGGGVVMSSIAAKAEGDPSLTVQPAYISFSTQHSNAGVFSFTEKVRITALGNVYLPAVTDNAGGGNLGIGTAAPVSKLQVVGLNYYADNATALAALGAGGFYRCGASDPTADQVCVAH